MNHNFADWELTQLLPEYNSNKLQILIHPSNYLIFNYSETLDLHEYYKDKLRFVWTWEDIRLYLTEKGYITFIFPDKASNSYSYDILKLYKEKQRWVAIEECNVLFSTYEEARREAIIYCLNLINNDN